MYELYVCVCGRGWGLMCDSTASASSDVCRSFNMLSV